MANRKRRKDEEAEGFDTPLPPFPPISPRAAEKALNDLHRMLAQKDIGSEEELEEFLQQLFSSGRPPDSPEPETPLEQAQDIMYEAWDTPSPARRIKLAKKALSISADCADAYVLLAEESAKSLPEAIKLYEQGVAAGERAIGPERFQEWEGMFWGILETRPYMRAREGLASLLWGTGQPDAAIGHFEDMLRLNPGDNQGIRYQLLTIYQVTENDPALQDLLKRYKDDYSAYWLYTQALVAFRRYRGGVRAGKKLAAALEYNTFVPSYLLGRKRMPKAREPFISPGHENEAIDYCAGAIPFWHGTPGALDWLREAVDKSGA